MKKFLKKILFLCLSLVMLVPGVPRAKAYMAGEPFQKDLSAFIDNEERRNYVEMMLDYHVRCNPDVRNALEGGFCAVFLFDGCSDNLDDPELSDLSYYRVSGVCVVLRLDAQGVLRMVYFNKNSSTIPDRPMEIGAWHFAEVGDVGPATVKDGTYQLYSVRHKGEYEALHMRTDYWDMTLDAVYLTADGFVTARANEINIHTRTSNHTSGRGMWSAGCPLVGGGSKEEFRRLMEATYYRRYDSFELENFVGTVTIDRQKLRQEMYTLYGDPDAVDVVLTNSREIQPEQYLRKCIREQYEEPEMRSMGMASQLMSLPCSNATDARSVEVMPLPEEKQVLVLGSVRNSYGNLWYQVECNGVTGYVFGGHTRKLGLLERMFGSLFD